MSTDLDFENGMFFGNLDEFSPLFGPLAESTKRSDWPCIRENEVKVYFAYSRYYNTHQGKDESVISVVCRFTYLTNVSGNL